MNPDKIVDRIKTKFDQHAHRRQLKETYSQRLVMFYNGGMFKITPELFSMLTIFDDSEMVLQDSFDNPIKVNRLEMLIEAKKRYRELMNDWLNDFDKTNQK